MAKKKSSATRRTYPPDRMLAIPAGWSQVDASETTRVTRCAQAFARYLTMTNALMRKMIVKKFAQVDQDFGERMTEFWLYDKGNGSEVIAVAFDRSLDRPNNDKNQPRRRNDWHITVGVHPDADIAPVVTLDAGYTAVKQLVAYQLQLADAHHPTGATTRQLFTAWRTDSAIKNEWPDQLFAKMMADNNVTLNVNPNAAQPEPPFGHFPISTKRVHINKITL